MLDATKGTFTNKIPMYELLKNIKATKKRVGKYN